ncbi:hypothetical protein GTP44_07895 [Duganella sp. FT50W]|uniref:Uncharacterized protein n=1 Tax=Duganella lactea TaxID=2692173 RepID=A0A6L8MFV2_9BURK|nr:hypothetical protein [Duganella lactea]MYM34433.1 hypothetical protein [Duganella lactea]MYM81880.1 hypothetical protein [Duganella lactea]
MSIYRSEGLRAYCEFEKALAEEHAVVHELAQCAKIEAYHLLASDLFDRVTVAHAKTIAAYKQIECFKQ